MTAVRDQQRAHLRAVINWSRKLREHLGPIQDIHGDRVHFRPSSTAVAMIGLLHDHPQQGKGGYRNLARLATNFEIEFTRWCKDVDQGRPTPEKKLQSHLLADAHTHGGALTTLSEASDATNEPVHLDLITDELAPPLGDRRKIVCDLLVLRRLGFKGEIGGAF